MHAVHIMSNNTYDSTCPNNWLKAKPRRKQAGRQVLTISPTRSHPLARAALFWENHTERLLSLRQHYRARIACIALLAPVLCMVTDHGRCGVQILQPLRSPVGCVCPQQSNRFKFARAWQPLPRSLTPHPPRTTPVWDGSTLARMQCEGEVIVLAGLLACVRPCQPDGIAAGISNMGGQQLVGFFSGAPMQCFAARQPCAHVPACACCLDYCWGHPQQVKG